MRKWVKHPFFPFRVKLSFPVLIFLLGFCFSFSYSPLFSNSSSLEWLVKKSTHFIVYYKQEPYTGFTDKFLRQAEKYYKSILDTLGYSRFDFWTWEKRCKVYIASSYDEYINETLQPLWSGANVDVEERTIRTYINDELFKSVLPHEMAHLVFREFVGRSVSLPLWLDEGVAALMEEDKEKRLRFAKGLVGSISFIPIEKLTELKQNSLSNPQVFYAEAASIIEFLLNNYGKVRFLEYSRCLRDRRDWEACLAKVYRFFDLSDMSEEWIEFLKK
jgi:hypothetical protein